MPFFGNCLFTLSLVGAILSLVTGQVQALAPPEAIRAQNLAATEILIGRVEAVSPAPANWRGLLPLLPQGEPWAFTLNLTHAVKSTARLKSGDRFKVLFVQEKASTSELSARRTGVSAVRVSPGDLVIVYANTRDQNGERLLLPVLAGLSVVRLSPPPPTGRNVSALK